MELKYYLRGLGLGIVVTALIMGFSHSGGQTMTDEEVIARAKQLGMIEDTVLTQKEKPLEDETQENESQENESQEGKSQEDEPQENTSEEVIIREQPDTPEEDIARVEEIQNRADEAGQKEEETAKLPEAEEAETTETEDTKVETPESETQEPVTQRDSLTITINSGDGSYTVSKKLADAGAVSSAETFDSFLCHNGYDKKIRTGTYTIPADASDEQMARIITGAEP